MLESAASAEAEIRHWPLSVRLRRRTVKRGLWEAFSWSIAALESDRHKASAADGVSMTSESVDEQHRDFIFSGLSLELFRDERPAYRFNLTSGDPRLFVVCNEDEDDAELMRPFLISASQDEAASYMDGGEEDVFSISMPEAIRCWIEAFIGRHGEPEINARKGKRRNHGGKQSQAAS